VVVSEEDKVVCNGRGTGDLPATIFFPQDFAVGCIQGNETPSGNVNDVSTNGS